MPRVREFNSCHNPPGPLGGRFCGKGGHPTPTYHRPHPRIDNQGRLSVGGSVERRSKRRKDPSFRGFFHALADFIGADLIGRFHSTFMEALSAQEILAEERARILEAWTDAARQASLSVRQSRAKGKKPAQAVPRGTQQAVPRTAQTPPSTFGSSTAKADTATTAAIRAKVAGAGAAQRGAVAAQKAGLDKVVADRVAQSKRLEGYKKRDEAAGKKAAADQQKAIAAEHDAKIKPIASQLQQMAMAGGRATPQYATLYKQYQQAKRAKAIAMGSTSVEAPQAPKKATSSAARTARVRTARAATSKANAFTKKKTVIRINR